MSNNQSEIRYLAPPTVEVKKKKYCRFKRNNIKYIDYKDPKFLKRFLNEQGNKISQIWETKMTLLRLKPDMVEITSSLMAWPH